MSAMSDLEEHQRFYLALGHCINQWAYVDQLLFDCCKLALGTDEKRAAIVYYRWLALSQRADLTDELVTNVITMKEHTDAWSAIRTAINDHLPLRNLIAHHPTIGKLDVVVQLSEDRKTSNTVSQKAWHQIETEQRELVRGKRKKRAISLKDLSDHHEAVSKLRDSLRDFLDALEKLV